MSKQLRQEIVEYNSMDLDSLFSLLGETEYAATYKFAPGKKSIEKGIEIFDSIKEKLYRKICIEWKYCEKRRNPKFSDTIEIITALIDVIAEILIHIPPALVATILVKKGLDKFCRCSE